MGYTVVRETRLSSGDASHPTIARLSDGSLVAGWVTTDWFSLLGLLAEGPSLLEGARIDVSGSAVDRFTVDSIIAKSDPTFDIATGPDRRFALSWSDAVSGSTGPTDVKAQVYAGANVRLGPQLLPTDLTSGAETESALAILSSRFVVVAWTEASRTRSDLDPTSIRAQLFDNAGNPVGSTFQVNTRAAGDQAAPTVVALDSARFVIAWDDGATVRAQLYRTAFAGGAFKLGGEIDLGPDVFNIRSAPGGFKITQEAIKADIDRTYDLKGQVVASAPTPVRDPRGQALPDGRFLATETDGGLVFLQVVTADGKDSGTRFRAGNAFGGEEGAFFAALNLGNDGLLASFKRSDTVAGILSTPIAENFVTILDLTSYIGDGTDESVFGGRFDDEIRGEGGNDLIEGREGDDILNGGEGDDSLDGGAGEDVVSGGPGDDVVLLSQSSGDADVIDGGDGFDKVVVTATGNSLHDLRTMTFSGVEALSVVAGEAPGKTVIFFNTATFSLGPGESLLLDGLDEAGAREMVRIAVEDSTAFSMRGWSFADWGGQGERIVIDGSRADDRIVGSAWNDAIRGRAGDDRLVGGARGDVLYGGPGDDMLIGGPAPDRLIGGPGADLFVFGPGVTRVTDFDPEAGDRIDISGPHDSFATEAFAYAAATNVGRNVQITSNGNTMILLDIQIGNFNQNAFDL